MYIGHRDMYRTHRVERYKTDECHSATFGVSLKNIDRNRFFYSVVFWVECAIFWGKCDITTHKFATVKRHRTA